MNRRNHRPPAVVFLPDLRGTNPYQALLGNALKAKGFTVYFSGDLTTRRPLLHLLLRKQIDVVHLHWTHPYVIAPSLARTIRRSLAFVAKLLLARMMGLRLVWTVHNLANHEQKFSRWEYRVHWLLARICHALVVHYPAAASIVRAHFRLGQRAHIVVAPHGHYIGAYLQSAKEPDPGVVARQTLTFLSVGLIRGYKRLSDLVLAFRRVSGNDLRLSIRGLPLDGEYAELLRSLGESDDRIALDLEYVPDDALWQLIEAADVFVVPQSEGLTSGALVLGMSCGKAVLAARTPHAEFLLGGNEKGGVLFEPDDIESMRRAIATVASRRDELARMGVENRQRIEAFDWLSTADQLRAAYIGRNDASVRSPR